jgi:hypothetical protein
MDFGMDYLLYIGGRSIWAIFASVTLKHESRLDGAASGTHANAILGRRPVPAVIKSRDAARAAYGFNLRHVKDASQNAVATQGD